MKRYNLSLDCTRIDDVTFGSTYPLRGGYREAKALVNAMNRDSERADRNAEMALDTKFRNDYDMFCKAQDLADEYLDKVEYGIRSFIKQNWNDKLEAYVKMTSTGHIEITVFDGELDLARFEQFIIRPIIKKYDLRYNGIETFKDANGKYSYFEWHLGRKCDG